jgi:hypothetical protein
VFYGVPEKRIKNMISSKTARIKGVHSINLSLVIQMSALQNYHEHAFKIFKSYIDDSILKLSSLDYESDKCKQYFRLKTQYLINKKFINTKFDHSSKALATILLRNQHIDTFMIIEYILNDSFDSMITSGTNDEDEISKRICLILCHFCRVKNIIPSHAQLIKSCNLEILLPNVPELDFFIETEKSNFDYFLSHFSLSKEEIELNRNGFSNFGVTKLPKNSYLYDYFRDGKLEKVREINNVSEIQLWYSLRDMRYLTQALKYLFSSKSDLIRNAFERYSSRLDDRFFKISN